MTMRLPLLLAGLLLFSGHTALAVDQPNSALVAQLPPQDSAGRMEFFNRELDRAEQLYDNLMFDEADRVADMTIARINAFLGQNRGIEGVDEIEAVYTARVNQLRQLKAFKAAAREQMERDGAANYDQKRAARERKLREQREHQYRMAVEARRIAEARAARWWSIWAGRSYSPILIFN
ncbi:hypothetical protein [Synechococcus sp. KORDI-52]|uniref:hypothetical protein n=1 Tax=Synechococcus sp. KORDI-52 TaxID=585425 RepID=UPI000ACCC956|nr:hypothetical protein [Synechococcus sp. KORDI-52]